MDSLAKRLKAEELDSYNNKLKQIPDRIAWADKVKGIASLWLSEKPETRRAMVWGSRKQFLYLYLDKVDRFDKEVADFVSMLEETSKEKFKVFNSRVIASTRITFDIIFRNLGVEIDFLTHTDGVCQIIEKTKKVESEKTERTVVCS